MNPNDLPKTPRRDTRPTPAGVGASEADDRRQPNSPVPEPDAVTTPNDDFAVRLDSRTDDGCFKKTLPLHAGALTVPEPASELEGRVLGRFRLEKEIARGGMGIIMVSRDIDLDREVAVKLLLKEHQGKPLLRQQFTNEARITGQLQHPGIIPIYQTGTTDDKRPYFAMKLVKGQTLAELLTARSSPEEELPRLLHIFEQVCQTLSYTHSCGVIHHDIKPANIMVGAFGEVHLMDWGLARVSTGLCSPIDQPKDVDSLVAEYAQQQMSRNISSDDLAVEIPAGAAWGTPAYMSPEQARGQIADLRTDVFGLGGILCEILTGMPPYPGKRFLDVCLRATRADLTPTYSRLINSGAAGVLVRLAMNCLAADPDDRPVDARFVANEMTLYLESLLRRAERDLERFFDLSLDLFCIAGFDGFFRRVNSNFPRVLGYPERELLSRPFLEFVHPEDREQTIDVMSQLRLGQPVVQFRNRYSVAYGTWRWFEWTAKSVPEDNIIFAVARDVTNRDQ